MVVVDSGGQVIADVVVTKEPVDSVTYELVEVIS